ncbi:DUF4167 domain-containing protein [Novosphingobium fluoreni]|uniref:DUF4167 domain-containing protein n=1 Tax=Novosphingobium fluoreni TaxID=1391222 RepID=UPI003DA0C26E
MNNNRNNNNNNNNRRRGRGNNRQQGGQQLNRIDSRARGNAPQMLEKYRKLAHDAHLNGDRVTEEYNLQFADHYFRVIADQRARQEEQRQQRPNDRPAEFGDEYAEDDYYAENNSPYDRAGNYAPSNQNVTGGNGQPQGGQPQGGQVGNNGQSNGGNTGNGQYPNGGAQAEAGGQRGGYGNDNRGNDNRQDRGRRNDRFERNDRPERGERRDRQDAQGQGSNQGQATPAAPVAMTEAAAAAPDASSEQTVYEPNENPFVREGRPARAPRARKPRRDDIASDGNVGASVENAAQPAGLDPASLPPAISTTSRAEAPRAETPQGEVAEEAPAKPKRRTRRAAPPADDAAGALPETVG